MLAEALALNRIDKTMAVISRGDGAGDRCLDATVHEYTEATTDLIKGNKAD